MLIALFIKVPVVERILERIRASGSEDERDTDFDPTSSFELLVKLKNVLEYALVPNEFAEEPDVDATVLELVDELTDAVVLISGLDFSAVNVLSAVPVDLLGNVAIFATYQE